MIYLMIALRYGLTLGALFAFPALALKAFRMGGRQRLVLATIAGFVVIAAYALVAASAPVNEAHAVKEDHASLAARTLLRFGVTLGLPLIATALATLALARDKLPYWTLYAATVAAAAFGWIAGNLCAFFLV